MNKYTSIFLILNFVLFACKGTGKQDPSSTMLTSVEDQTALDAEFKAFYERFHLDSTYQMAHIIFPLEGVPVIRDTVPDNLDDFKWTRENWNMHRPFDLSDGSFARDMYQYGDKLIVEKIEARQMGFGMERRFAKLQGEWYLIYYAAMNKL